MIEPIACTRKLKLPHLHLLLLLIISAMISPTRSLLLLPKKMSKRSTSRLFFSSSPSSTSQYETVSAQASQEAKSKPAFKIFYNDVYEVQLPKGHRFPMDKYRRVRENIQKLISELPPEEQERVCCEFEVSPLATQEELTTTHTPDYVSKVMTGNLTERELRNVGFPWSQENVKRSLSSTGGTLAAARFVCQKFMSTQGKANSYPPIYSAHVAGGTHHAFADRGEGFCVFNDIAVAANVVLREYPTICKKILIIDLDVHQGNGSAFLFKDNPNVVTFSLHCSANYFSKKEESDLDVELPPGSTDSTYLMTLSHWLNRIEKEGGPFQLVFFQAGVDILLEDRLGRMAISHKGLETRNQLVFDFAKRMNAPLVITMGGGYPKNDDWAPILKAHSNVYLQARKYLANWERQQERRTSD
jgi:acetoin utilization deacetylase AcuC-like enzyme